MTSLRPIHIAFDALAGVDGSARFSFGETCTALASVSGPVAARPASEHPARATVEVHVRPLSLVPGTTEKFLGAAFKGILERACILGQHPRTLIQVVVQALSRPSHALVPAQINACSLALVNSGSIPMRGVVCAVAVGLRKTEGRQTEFVLDPVEESKLDGAGCLAFLFGIGPASVQGGLPPSEVLWTNFRTVNGSVLSLQASELAQATTVARKGATEVWLGMKKSLAGSSFLDDEDSKMEM
ncbi:ribosomal protein S5 domain 2-type protein [Scleroderma yunnanense]